VHLYSGSWLCRLLPGEVSTFETTDDMTAEVYMRRLSLRFGACLVADVDSIIVVFKLYCFSSSTLDFCLKFFFSLVISRDKLERNVV